jgi:ABC-type phosphate transport system auxiliary subunit
MHVLDLIPRRVGWVLIAIFSLLFAADAVISVMVMAGLNKRMAEIDEMREKMRVISNDLSEHIGSKALETAQHVDEAKVQTALAKAEAKDQMDLARAKLESRKAELEQKRSELVETVLRSRHFGAGRLLRAFPDMKHRDYEELIDLIKGRLGNYDGC